MIHRVLRDYFSASDASDKGRHGLLHEFGEYYANRLRALREGASTRGSISSLTSASWRLFLVYYLTVAPLHSFLSNMMQHEAEAGGEPLERWVPRFCSHFYNASSIFANASNSDLHRHLFSECGHGAGHGAMKLRNLSWCVTLAEAIALEPGPSADPKVRESFYKACLSGVRHHAHNEFNSSNYTKELVFPPLPVLPADESLDADTVEWLNRFGLPQAMNFTGKLAEDG